MKHADLFTQDPTASKDDIAYARNTALAARGCVESVDCRGLTCAKLILVRARR